MKNELNIELFAKTLSEILSKKHNAKITIKYELRKDDVVNETFV